MIKQVEDEFDILDPSFCDGYTREELDEIIRTKVVEYVRPLKIGDPISNQEKTAKEISLWVKTGSDLVIKINGNETKPRRDRGSRFVAGNYAEDRYWFKVNSGDTYQIITEAAAVLRWKEIEYDPEVRG